MIDMSLMAKVGARTWMSMAVWLMALLLLAACQPIVDTRSAGEAGSTPADTAPPPALDETQAALVEQASQMMAEELGVDVETVELLTIESVDWPDTSLGCPQPDMMYASMITPGYAITLQAGDTVQVYHSTTQADGNIVTCEP
ncbi:MAG: hypothetical protein HC802_18130 [Caldilineaceae bacterium]|nr:hypothetical protein [Caldilineaceae bacterium]